MELEWEADERAKEVRAAAVHQYSEELSDPINGLLGAVTSIMVDYACVRRRRRATARGRSTNPRSA